MHNEYQNCTTEVRGDMFYLSLQEVYHTTHQCFYSKRSMYLALFRLTDGEKGIDELEQWLSNIRMFRYINPQSWPPLYISQLVPLYKQAISVISANWLCPKGDHYIQVPLYKLATTVYIEHCLIL